VSGTLPFSLDRLAGCGLPALADDASGDSFLLYRDLVRRVRAVAERLAGLGGPLTFLFGRNDIPTTIVSLAAFAARAPVALFRADLARDRALDLVARYRPGLVIGIEPGTPAAPAEGFGLAAWSLPEASATHPDLALLLSTSGSTGSPRLVRLSRTAVEANAAQIVEALRIAAEDRAALPLPLSYSYGLSVLNSHLLAGASIVLTDRGLTERPLWDRLAELRVTSMPGVPYVYQTLDRLGFEKLLPPSLRVLTQAGGRLAEPLVERFHRFMTARGGRFHVMYGQTEATARIAVLDSAALPARLGSVGRALPGGSLWTRPAGTGEAGEILYRGPNVMMGYAEEAADLALGDRLGGVLATGDLGEVDPEGYLRITGRLKQIAKVNGLRVNLDEVEALASRYAPAAALETPSGLAILLEAPEDAELAQHARRELAAMLALPPASLRVRLVERLPRGASGKLDRAALADLA
jgi:acyl-CoA synthetase (AMP-forming)/AMP-acid ligase II